MEVQELLDLSLISSDNIATNMLGERLGGHPSVRKELYNILNIPFKGDLEENSITPSTEFKILEYVYNNRENPNYAHMIKTMTNTDFKDRSEKYLPYGISAHKIGSYDSYIHDVAIVLDENPYVFIMYTKDIPNSEEEISIISKAIYETHRKTCKGQEL